MNSKERLAGFIVLATLLLGIIAGLIDRDDRGIHVSNGADSCASFGESENRSRSLEKRGPNGEFLFRESSTNSVSAPLF